MLEHPILRTAMAVAPRTGVWIETNASLINLSYSARVAPRTGAWIETHVYRHTFATLARRPPHGGVD